jgi:hypothetical protein
MALRGQSDISRGTRQDAGACQPRILVPRALLKLWLEFGASAPLEPAIRRFMEARLGADLGAVRIHTGAAAARLCDTLQARALTLGNDILFADGDYAPWTADGLWLLAHELVHVLQQRAASGPSRAWLATPGFVAVGDEFDACEHEADRLAAEALGGGLRSVVTPDRSGAMRRAPARHRSAASSAAAPRATGRRQP